MRQDNNDLFKQKVKLTLCAKRSCCTLRPVRSFEKDDGATEARVTEESVRCIMSDSIEGRTRGEKK